MADMFYEWYRLIPGLFNNMAVVVLCAYIFSHFSSDILFTEQVKKKRHIILLSIIGSALGIFGTINSIPILDVQSNIRNIGPIIAGLLGGPIPGVIAGLVSGTHRYCLGGSTADPCALAAIFAGLFSGIVFHINKGKFIGVKGAVLATVIIEVVHSGLILLMQKPMSVAIASQSITLPARIIIESLGIGFFSFILHDIIKMRRIREEKHKVEKELSIARDIQLSILPKIFPPQPGWPEIEVYGVVQAAREVGGDFFDFFKIDKNKICFVVGDVSDKGVPASLYMAVTKTLLKAKFENNTDPSGLLHKVNKELCEGNDSLMYVTLFIGVLDSSNGELCYCNAGHLFPYLIQETSIHPINEKGGMALGVMPDAVFKTSRLTLGKNDMIFVYTDGVTDAKNSHGETLSDSLLLDYVSKAQTEKSVKNIIENLRLSINQFQDPGNQFDDITLLALKRN
jgi:phosphoserine phosphatase RsbU/P